MQLSARNTSLEWIQKIDPTLKRNLLGLITYFRVNCDQAEIPFLTENTQASFLTLMEVNTGDARHLLRLFDMNVKKQCGLLSRSFLLVVEDQSLPV